MWIMAAQTHRLYYGTRHLLLPAVIGVAVYVLVPQIGDFKSSWNLLSHPRTGLTLLAVILTFMTFLAGAGTYLLLSFGKLRYGRTLLVQLAATFVNRLLPAGIGALGANYLYMRHERFGAGKAGSIAAINNLLGVTGHFILLALTLSLSSERALIPVDLHMHTSTVWKIALLAVIALSLVLYLGKRRLDMVIRGVRSQLRDYGRHPWWLGGALATSMALTLCNVLCLYCCLRALDLHTSFASALLVFTFGLGAGSIVPTPGGLGGFEAGLTAGFVAYGIDAAPALAVALLYRLISYWLPMVLGAAAFVICERQGSFRSRSG